MQTEINSEGLCSALLTAHKAEERKLKDKEVIVWAHLAKMLMGKRNFMPTYKVSKKLLFRMMNTNRSRAMLKAGMKDYVSDEVPTDFMKKLYKEYVEWITTHPKSKLEE